MQVSSARVLIFLSLSYVDMRAFRECRLARSNLLMKTTLTASMQTVVAIDSYSTYPVASL